MLIQRIHYRLGINVYLKNTILSRPYQWGFITKPRMKVSNTAYLVLVTLDLFGESYLVLGHLNDYF